MSDAATDWIAPYWEIVRNSSNDFRTARVWVVNPASTPSEVTVRFLNVEGGLNSTYSLALQPQQIMVWEPTPIEGWLFPIGWCAVTSQYPVMPWGVTPYREDDNVGYVNMSFYRADAPLAPIRPEPLEEIDGA
jgi:hypothetical protein